MTMSVVEKAALRLKQASVAGVERAAQVLNHSGSMQAVGSSAPTGSKLATGNTIIVPQIHGKTPLHILPNQHPQPWELMPLRAAAMRDYPNFLNVSTGFFGSLNRDIKGSMPFCLLKPNRLALDLAKVVTNLGIVASFDLLTHMTHSLQRTPRQRFTAANASSVTPTTAALHHPLRYVRLHLRYDMHRPLWEVAEEQARIGGARRRGVQQQLDEYAAARRASQLEVSTSPRPSCMSLPMGLPHSATNISRASKPVMMTPKALEQKRAMLPSGIFLLYHHTLGIITDAQAEQYDVPGLVMAHLGLPWAMVAQISGALREKARAEAGMSLTQVQKLKDWSMLHTLQSSIDARFDALGVHMDVPSQIAQIEDEAERLRHQHTIQLNLSKAESSSLHEELLAWELVHTGALEVIPEAYTAPKSGVRGPAPALGGGPRGGGVGQGARDSPGSGPYKRPRQGSRSS